MPRQPLDRTSVVLASIAVLAVFAWVGYDRWHDGLWPFRNTARQIAGGYGRAR